MDGRPGGAVESMVSGQECGGLAGQASGRAKGHQGGGGKR